MSAIALGVYEFTQRTLKMYAHSLLTMPYVSVAIHVAAERQFIAWKQVHAAVGGSYETYQQALTATVASSGKKTVFDDIFASDSMPRLHMLVEGAHQAVSGAPSLEIVPGLSAPSLMARPSLGFGCLGPHHCTTSGQEDPGGVPPGLSDV